MTDTKNTESSRIETLIPQQLISDSTALIEFLKQYYKFLTQSGQPTDRVNTILQNKDLDSVVDQFISLIEKELGYSMVSTMEANKLNVYKNIEEFYEAKGSLDSIKLLFRLLYNVEIDISLPKEQILIASDGRWAQQNVIFVESVSGNIFSIVNTQVQLVNPDQSVIDIEPDRVRFIADNIYEVNIDQNFTGTIQKNATITTSNFSGKITTSLGGFTILRAGKNFTLGQILEINDGINDSSKSLIKVTKVNSNGGIIDFEFIRFGLGYNNDFTSYLIPVNYDLDFESNPADYGFSSDKLGRVFESLSSNDYFTIELNPYSIGYFAEDYFEGSRFSGDYDAVFNQSSQISEIDQELVEDQEAALEESYANRALVEFKNTALSKYAGSFSTNNGFLSDDIYLQDNNYYQAFSYVIKSDKRFQDYENIVRKTAHPAGMALFGQFEITNQLDISTQIELLERLYSERLVDSVDTLEAVAKLVLKPVDDEVITSEFWYYDYDKPLTENISLIEFIEKKITNKPQFDNISTSDVISDILFYKNPSDTIITSEDVDVVLDRRLFDSIGAIDSGITEQSNVYAQDYFAQVYSEGLVETGVDKDFFKVLSDIVTTDDEDYAIQYAGNGAFLNDAHPIDVVTSSVLKEFTNNTTLSDAITSINSNKLIENSINTSDSGTIEFNPYSIGYFASDYVEGITPF